MIAAFMAIEFTKALKSAKMTRPIEFMFVSVKTFATKRTNGEYRFMTCELRCNEDVKFIRFSNNAGWFLIDDEACEHGIDPQHVATVLAFSHWTHAVTYGKLMIVDPVGVVTGDECGRSTILLTDPTIHCVHFDRYGDLNRGTDEIESFFETHECNSVAQRLS